MSGLTTHVLDTMHGKPAAGVGLRLIRDGVAMKSLATNQDGRCDSPLLRADELAAGRYRLEFEVGAYFRGMGVDLPEPAFLETIAIDFGVAEADGHYHVPLLVSPFAYSTYRGS